MNIIFYGESHSFSESFPFLVQIDSDLLSDQLSISFGCKFDTLGKKFFFEFLVVIKSSIMDKHHTSILIEVWMSIIIGFSTAGCPSSMSYSYETSLMKFWTVFFYVFDAIDILDGISGEFGKYKVILVFFESGNTD